MPIEVPSVADDRKRDYTQRMVDLTERKPANEHLLGAWADQTKIKAPRYFRLTAPDRVGCATPTSDRTKDAAPPG